MIAASRAAPRDASASHSASRSGAHTGSSASALRRDPWRSTAQRPMLAACEPPRAPSSAAKVRAPAPGRTHAAGGTAGRAVEPAGRPARGEESLALLQVHRACAFRDRGTSSRTSSSRGTERRGTARARSVAGAWVTPWSGGGDVRVSSALPEARLEVPRRFGDRSRTELRSEKKVNGTMLCAAFSDRSRYHLIDKAVSKSQKSDFFNKTAKKRTACWCDLEVGTRRAFLGTDVHARARHLRVEGWKRPRRATRARPPRRRGETTPRASPGRCTTPRPTRTRRETMRMKSPCVIFTSPLAAP